MNLFFCLISLFTLFFALTHTFATDLNCKEIIEIAKPFQIHCKSADFWWFSEEFAIKNEIEKKTGAKLPKESIPMGYVEESLNDGQKVLLVFDFNPTDQKNGKSVTRSAVETRKVALDHALDFLRKKDSNNPDPKNGFQFGPGIFEQVHFYRGNAGAMHFLGTVRTSEGRQIESTTFFQTNDSAEVKCVPCKGWLCHKENFVCITHFNLQSVPEFHFSLFGAPNADFVSSYGYSASDKMERLIEKMPETGKWIHSEDGWIFNVPPFQERTTECLDIISSRGSPGKIYSNRKDPHTFRLDTKLTRKYFPFETKTLPSSCSIKITDPKGNFFWTNDHKLIKYVPHP